MLATGTLVAVAWGAFGVGLGGTFEGPAAPVYRTYSGQAQGDRFGGEVVSGGDVNGDGVQDYAVSAIGYGGTSGTGVGRIHVYSGKTGKLLWTADGTQEHDTNTHSGGKHRSDLAIVEDLDGDGLDDLLVGDALFDGPAGVESGQVRIYSGTGALLGVLHGDTIFSFFGSTVSGVGDVDGDGKGEFIVGAPRRNPHGRVYLYTLDVRGNPALIRTWDTTPIFGFLHVGGFGFALSGIGDFNGDGTPDFVAVAPDYPQGTSYTVLSVYSTSGPLLWTDLEAAHGNEGGHAIGIGDVNGDGYDDMAVDSKEYGGNKVQVYLGGASGTGTLHFVVHGVRRQGMKLGQQISAADLDGDGLNDVIIGSVPSASEKGRVAVYSGLTGQEILAWTGGEPGAGGEETSAYGGAVAGIDDLNGDGRAEILVGDWRSRLETGKVQVLSGR